MSNNNDNIWPIPEFRFNVYLGYDMKAASFQQVSGLHSEDHIIEYRDSNSSEFSTIQMPGINKTNNVTLKRGVLVNDNFFWNWLNDLNLNVSKRQTITIQLLNENGSIAMQWRLVNAYPTKISNSDIKNEDNEVAIDLVEIKCEQITIN